jgi:hypothetical protein
MLVCSHRINTIDDLKGVQSRFGIEFDVREGPHGKLIVTHDPWTHGPTLDDFLKHCHHAFYIVNIKCEGIEHHVLERLYSHGIHNFFLLDCSFPMIHKLATMGENRLAVRISEYEDMSTARRMQGRVEWIWMDAFQALIYDDEYCAELHQLGYKICLVSPELQKQPHKLETYKTQVGKYIDMVCTKFTEAWSSDVSPPANEESQQTASP